MNTMKISHTAAYSTGAMKGPATSQMIPCLRMPGDAISISGQVPHVSTQEIRMLPPWMVAAPPDSAKVEMTWAFMAVQEIADGVPNPYGV
jgi:hypothetical protein